MKELKKAKESSTADACRICGGILSGSVSVREMMFGTREIFDYSTCEECGCMQIAVTPENLELYYGDKYYSYKQDDNFVSAKRISKNRRRYLIRRSLRFLGSALAPPRTIFHALGQLGIGWRDRILDVGSGAGGLVSELYQTGFGAVLGIDPFLNTDVVAPNGRVLVRKASVFEIEGPWRLIMFNHSFEHMDDQADVLRRCGKILAPGGILLIRIPTISSYAFRTYRENWVQLDAPRHLYLHSRKSIGVLAEAAGFRVVRMWDDSTPLQFVGSEQYLNDIPLMAGNSQIMNQGESMFTKKRMRNFRRQAERLNRLGDGDQICVVLAGKSKAILD